MLLLLRLFFEFFKTGLFAVGGGLATLPFLYEMGSKTGWFTAADIADMIAVSESTPGPMGVNMATYVGVKTAGLPGGAVATLGLVCPSLIVIIIVARILNRFKDSALVKKVFYALRPASAALITAAGLGVARIALLRLDIFKETHVIFDLLNWKCILLAVAVYIGIRLFHKHPVLYIALSALAGVIFSL
ncbi:MAG: chromate transporter [Lachnospiraceae bacterium]|nr:chromate transporter [Lachnospiraceae bacterium]